jgi:hypothetical protein
LGALTIGSVCERAECDTEKYLFDEVVFVGAGSQWQYELAIAL